MRKKEYNPWNDIVRSEHFSLLSSLQQTRVLYERAFNFSYIEKQNNNFQNTEEKYNYWNEVLISKGFDILDENEKAHVLYDKAFNYAFLYKQHQDSLRRFKLWEEIVNSKYFACLKDAPKRNALSQVSLCCSFYQKTLPFEEQDHAKTCMYWKKYIESSQFKEEILEKKVKFYFEHAMSLNRIPQKSSEQKIEAFNVFLDSLKGLTLQEQEEFLKEKKMTEETIQRIRQRT